LIDKDDSCHYFFKDTGGNVQKINHDRCECSLMDTVKPKTLDEKEDPPILLPNGTEMIPLQLIEPNLGYCPFPTQVEINAYIKTY